MPLQLTLSMGVAKSNREKTCLKMMPFLIQCEKTPNKLKWINRIYNKSTKETKDITGKEGNTVVSKSADSAGDRPN